MRLSSQVSVRESLLFYSGGKMSAEVRLWQLSKHNIASTKTWMDLTPDVQLSHMKKMNIFVYNGVKFIVGQQIDVNTVHTKHTKKNPQSISDLKRKSLYQCDPIAFCINFCLF